MVLFFRRRWFELRLEGVSVVVSDILEGKPFLGNANQQNLLTEKIKDPRDSAFCCSCVDDDDAADGYNVGLLFWLGLLQFPIGPDPSIIPNHTPCGLSMSTCCWAGLTSFPLKRPPNFN